MDDMFSWKWQLSGNCGEVSCTWGELSFPLVHAFQANIWTKGNLRDPTFTRNHSLIDQTTSPLLSTQDPISLDHGLQRYYLVLLDFLMAFLLEIWTYILAFPCVSQGPLLKASKGPIKILGLWCWFFLLHIHWPDWDPCCMSSGLIKSRSSYLFIIIIIISLLFLLFGTLGLHGPS